jgi:hypothetical protein
MKKVLACVALGSLVCLAAPPASSARSERTQKAAAKIDRLNCTVKFHNLARYKGEGWSRVFKDREVAPALKALLKRDYRKLVESLKSVEYPDSLSFVDQNGVLKLEGGVPGLRTIMEAVLIVEPCGNIYAAVLDQGERILYFTNDKEKTGKLPPAIEEWRQRLESSRSSTGSKPELPVLFKSR